MNGRDLEYALALADEKHFGQAAARCGVSQPTLSTQIARLENDLGVSLFERGPKGVTVRPAGRRFVQQARIVLDELDRLRRVVQEDRGKLAGPFRLGAIPTVGPYLLPHALPVLRACHPEAELYIREATTDRLLRRLGEADLDAAVVSLPVDDPGLLTEPILEEPFVAALPAGHRLRERKRLKLADLSSETVLLLEDGHCMRAQTLALCEVGGARKEAQGFQASSLESLRQMVAAGMGCTILPWFATVGPFAERSVGGAGSILLKRFSSPVPKRPLVLAWRRSRPQGRLLRELAGAIGKALRGTMREAT